MLCIFYCVNPVRLILHLHSGYGKHTPIFYHNAYILNRMSYIVHSLLTPFVFGEDGLAHLRLVELPSGRFQHRSVDRCVVFVGRIIHRARCGTGLFFSPLHHNGERDRYCWLNHFDPFCCRAYSTPIRNASRCENFSSILCFRNSVVAANIISACPITRLFGFSQHAHHPLDASRIVV